MNPLHATDGTARVSAWVEIGKPLPALCAYCGSPAQELVPISFSWTRDSRDGNEIAHILLTPTGTATATVSLPACQRHRVVVPVFALETTGIGEVGGEIVYVHRTDYPRRRVKLLNASRIFAEALNSLYPEAADFLHQLRREELAKPDEYLSLLARGTAAPAPRIEAPTQPPPRRDRPSIPTLEAPRDPALDLPLAQLRLTPGLTLPSLCVACGTVAGAAESISYGGKTIALPVCDAHRGYAWRQFWIALAAVVLVLVAVFGSIVIGSTTRNSLWTFLGIGFSIAAGVGVGLFLMRSWVHVTPIGAAREDGISFQHLSPDFVAAYLAAKKAEPSSHSPPSFPDRA